MNHFKTTNLLLVLVVSLTALQAQDITGTVFNDINRNGKPDVSEKGIAGVAVSDQINVVLTDQNGKYTIAASAGYGVVMVSVPEGFTTLRSFWSPIQSDQRVVDFPMVASAKVTAFTFIHASDTHVSEKSVDRMEKLKKIVDQNKPDFILVTGDLVRDALRVPEEEATRLYKLYVSEIGKFTRPVWSVPGNHENFGIERHLSLVPTTHPLYGKKMYRSYLGPNYYSFNYGGVHFIGLDDVDVEDTWYYGHVDEQQVQWMKNDLAVVPKSMPVVTFAHIPFFSGGHSLGAFEANGPGRTLEVVNGKQQYRHVVSNAMDILEVLKDHPYPLNLTGHYHARQVYWYESPRKVRFEQAGAVVGPSSEGAIEFPSGVTLYSVKNGEISEGTFLPLDK